LTGSSKQYGNKIVSLNIKEGDSMTWTQEVNPFNNIAISAFAAIVPIIFIFWALIIRKMKGYLASLITMLLAIFVVLLVYHMPLKLSLLSALQGAMYGFFPICWIIIAAVFLYNISVASGQFEIIKSFMSSITDDRRLQALLIAFSFGSFLEGASGLGTPIAITSAMLVGMGFNPIYASGVCLIANTAPVAFGSVGTPIIIASQVSGMPELAISQVVGRTLPVIALFVPFYLVVLMAGFKRSLEVLPAILLSGIVFAVVQFLVANYLGPMLPSLMAGLASIVSLMVLLRYWKPKTIWRFPDERESKVQPSGSYTTGQIIRAWSPFILMTATIIAWGLQPVKEALNSAGDLKFYIPGLQHSILNNNGTPLLIKPFDFSYLSNSGTGVLLSAIISLPLIGMSIKKGFGVFIATLKQLKFPIITITSIVGFAFVANNSGLSMTIALALAGTGVLFPFFSPVLGWLGVFMTGSDTSSNALFCRLQRTTASTLNIDPLITVSANTTGGVMGKMISPQSIAVGTAAIGLVGKESDLFRFTIKHSFIMLFVICVITTLQAYVLKWIIPKYTIADEVIPAAKTSISSGFVYLGYLLAVIFVIIISVILLNRKKRLSGL
jgi:lactate permease